MQVPRGPGGCRTCPLSPAPHSRSKLRTRDRREGACRRCASGWQQLSAGLRRRIRGGHTHLTQVNPGCCWVLTPAHGPLKPPFHLHVSLHITAMKIKCLIRSNIEIILQRSFTWVHASAFQPSNMHLSSTLTSASSALMTAGRRKVDNK